MTVPSFHPLYQQRLPLLAGLPPMGMPDSPEIGRRRWEFDKPFGEPDLPEVDIDEMDAEGPNGPVRLRVYRRRAAPSASEPRTPTPGLVWIHGGGFMMNDLDVPEADHFGRVIADRTGSVIVSVGYRLCDEVTKFPVPHDDCYAAYAWVRQHAERLGIDADRIAVGGGSAGGNLAASVALHAAQAGRPAWQMLLAYPVMHPAMPAPSADLAAALAVIPEALTFTPEAIRTVNEFVLGRPEATATPYDFPGLAHDFAQYPPAYIENSEFDTLRASGERFAEQLRQDGVAVECVTARGVPHGHLNAVGSPMLAEAYGRFAARLVSR